MTGTGPSVQRSAALAPLLRAPLRSPLAVLVRLDARLVLRHGVVTAVAVVTVVWAVALRVLPRQAASAVIAPALYLDAAVVGILFLGGMVLIERRQGTLEAFAVSPLRARTYVASKVLVLTALAMAAVTVIAVTAAPTVRPVPLLAGVLLLSPPVLTTALVVAARADTITAYLLRVQAPLSPAVVPLLGAAGWVPAPLVWLGPTTGPYRLLEAGVGGPAPSAAVWATAVAVSGLVTAGLGRLAVRRVARDLFRSGRLT